MIKVHHIFILFVLLLSACQLKLKPNNEDDRKLLVEVQRYDRLESRYLTTGDYSALQQMNTTYPMETRTLIEDVLNIGEVNETGINAKFLNFYQDSLLQVIIADAESEFVSMDDINKDLSKAFRKLQRLLLDLKVPVIYSQIGALDQSIVIGNDAIGISLDKYLGADYPIYRQFYTERQRESMKREFIVPDCLVFYLLSKYPLNKEHQHSDFVKELHMAKMMWTTNKLLGRRIYQTSQVNMIDQFMRQHRTFTLEELLKQQDYSSFEVHR